MPFVRRQGRGFRRSGRPVRPMDWECAQLRASVVGHGKACEWLIPPLIINERYTDPTLMATRAWIAAQYAGVSLTNTFVGIGIISWNYESGDPPDPCPGPIEDCDLDWIARWICPIPLGFPDQTRCNPVIFDLAHHIKARRRLGNDSSILVAVEGDVDFIGTMQIAADFRMLIKE